MQMSVISFDKAKELVLADLRQTMMKLPVAERERPRYVIGDFKPISIVRLIIEVEKGTTLGRQWVYQRAAYIGYRVR